MERLGTPETPLQPRTTGLETILKPFPVDTVLDCSGIFSYSYRLLLMAAFPRVK